MRLQISQQKDFIKIYLYSYQTSSRVAETTVPSFYFLFYFYLVLFKFYLLFYVLSLYLLLILLTYLWFADGSQERTVSLLVDGEETELSCEDPNDSSYEVDENTFCATDAFLLVYSVTRRKTLTFAVQTLEKLRRLEVKCQYFYPNLGPKVYILVANKVDLVRCRTISTDEGKSLADKLDVKYIETSVGFNHNVDELLVGIVTQIRLKTKQRQTAQTTVKNFIARSMKFTYKTRGFIDRLLQKCDLKTRSCDNLNIL
ncbi:GTP-binding protein GEM-like [Stegodyphus dumicola]|uniref:GTP-binding protein GEM-like n=1 Tax=Stegodyphus dumicola TaxID=202533 RepID=UPI0015AE1496|nr:GTP-binding protein GEM-like [Stegodyphus dumicola]